MAKITIQCADCDKDREIQFAHRSLIKRCKDCQVEYNRDQARNRYRKKHGIPLDKSIITPKPPKKKKKPKSERPYFTTKETQVVKGPKAVQRTPEEEKQHQKAIELLFSLIDDDSTTDDW
jgi:hypothetical protein